MTTLQPAGEAMAALESVGALVASKAKHTDLLDMDYINNLPHPLWVTTGGKYDWPVHDIDVETGLLRIDACGMLDVMHIGNFITIKDGNGKQHYTGDLYTDQDSWEDRATTKEVSP